MEQWLEVNRDLSAQWPNITRKGEAPPDADEFRDVPDKYAKYFSDKPAKR
jgi:ferredoxin